MNKTKIEWCDHTINPVVGCSKCSPGCDNCYAERRSALLAKNPATAQKYRGVIGADGKWTGQTNGVWIKWPSPSDKRPKRIFVGSMCDMFHEDVEFTTLVRIFAIAAHCRQHTFMFLTKRPKRMRAFMTDTSTPANDARGRAYKDIAGIFGADADMDGLRWPLPNVWLGVTVCNQDEADEKIPVLLDIPAAKRFVSIEPMLGPVNLRFRRTPTDRDYNGWNGDGPIDYVETTRMDELHWVICGGETGPKARPVHPDWVRGLRDQCQQAGVPFFFKSWGEWLPDCQTSITDHNPWGFIFDDGWYERGEKNACAFDAAKVFRFGKKRAGRLLDGREWNEVPQ